MLAKRSTLKKSRSRTYTRSILHSRDWSIQLRRRWLPPRETLLALACACHAAIKQGSFCSYFFPFLFLFFFPQWYAPLFFSILAILSNGSLFVGGGKALSISFSYFFLSPLKTVKEVRATDPGGERQCSPRSEKESTPLLLNLGASFVPFPC